MSTIIDRAREAIAERLESLGLDGAAETADERYARIMDTDAAWHVLSGRDSGGDDCPL